MEAEKRRHTKAFHLVLGGEGALHLRLPAGEVCLHSGNHARHVSGRADADAAHRSGSNGIRPYKGQRNRGQQQYDDQNQCSSFHNFSLNQYERLLWFSPWQRSEQVPWPGLIRVNCSTPLLFGATMLKSKFTSMGDCDAWGSWQVEHAARWSTTCTRCFPKLRSTSTLFCTS